MYRKKKDQVNAHGKKIKIDSVLEKDNSVFLS